MDASLQPSFDIWAFLVLVAASQGLFLGFVLLLNKRGNQIANRLLAALIFVFSLRAIENVAYWTKFLLVFPHMFGTTAPFLYLYGPLLYFYTRSLTSQQLVLKKRYLLHVLPYLIHTGFNSRLYIQGSEFKNYLLVNFVFVEHPVFSFDLNFFLAAFKLPHMLLYIFLTLKLLSKYAQNINSAQRTLDWAKLDWLRKLTAGFGVFWSFWFVYNIAMILGVKYHQELDYLVTGSLFLIIFGICYMTLRQPEVFSGFSTLQRSAKYEKSNLTPVRAEAHIRQLVHLIKSEQPFLQQGLKLEDLAHRLSVSPHHLSQILNERLGQNFYDFINGYRIEQAKVKLTDPEQNHFTILSIAYEVGFNNKASFNSAFKKHTGMTPSQFRKMSQK